MISGIVLMAGLSLAANPQPSKPGNADLVAAIPPATTALIASLRRPAPAETAYTEVRFVRMLQRPLILRGELHYGGPSELGKRVDKPYRETTTISAGQVTLQREGKSAQHFSLERAPELDGLLGSFSAMLGGDAEALNRYFSIGVEREAGNWRMTLTPRAPALAKKFHDLIVDGRGNDSRCFTLHEADGDTSVMLLGELASAKLADPPTVTDVESLCRGSKL
jgi:Outer membrane lipoprotein carrier protein LolA-like